MLKNIIYKSVNGSEFEVVRLKGNCSYIRFNKTGYVCRAKNNLIKKGLVFDPTVYIESANQWRDYTEEFTTNFGDKFVAYKRNGSKVKIIFPDNKYSTIVNINNARQGKVSNPYAVNTYGVGKLGVFDRKILYWEQARQLWRNMIKRCYCELDERGYYQKAFVDERWHTFENFLVDISKLDGFKGWLDGYTSGLKWNLDKDFIFPGNDTYSRHLCCFLPESFNKSLGKKGKTEKDWTSN